MRQKQATCQNCGPSLFSSREGTTAAERALIAFGLFVFTVATCGLGLPFAIIGFIYWLKREEKERAIFRCQKCGGPELEPGQPAT